MEIREKVPLNEWTWWKIGGPADYFCLPKSIDEVREAVLFARSRNLPITVLGGGTNVLVHDSGVAGLVICMKNLVGSSVREDGGRVVVEALAGTNKSELTKVFLRRKLAPALFLCGLPGDVGGGVVMNAGIGEKVAPREFVEITDWFEYLDLSAPEVPSGGWRNRKHNGDTATSTAISPASSFARRSPGLIWLRRMCPRAFARRPKIVWRGSRWIYRVVGARSRIRCPIRPEP